MSVINNVLKDLETRESSFAPIEFPALENRAERRPGWRPLLLGLLLLVTASAAGWYVWRFGIPVDPAQWLQRIPGIAGVTVAEQVHETKQANSAQVTEVAENESRMAIENTLPQNQPEDTQILLESVPSTVALEPVEVIEPVGEAPVEIVPRNQIIGLQMREADSEMHLEFSLRDKVIAYMTERNENGFSYHLRDIDNQIVAPVLSDNRWLESLSISSQDDGVDVRFETVAGILVETRQQLGEEEHVWRISFRQPEPVVEPPVIQPVEQSVELAKTETVAVPVQPAPKVESSTTEQKTAVLKPLPAEAKPEIAIATPSEETPNTVSQEPDPVKLDIRTTNPNATEINQLKYALELINSGRRAEAEKLLQSLLYGSEDHAARTHLLALYGRQGRHDRLARLAQNSLAQYPGDEVFLTEYARSRYQSKDYRIALELLSGIYRLNADQHALIAASHQRLEHHDRAVEHYQKALALDAGNAKNWVGLGISMEHTADLEKALQAYRNAMKLGTLNERLLTFVEKRSATLVQVLN